MALPYGTSLLDVRATVPEEKDIEEQDGLRLFSLPVALIASSPGFFENNPTDARAALAAIGDASQVLERLLEGGHTTIAGLLRCIRKSTSSIADNIIKAMRAAIMTCARKIVRQKLPSCSRAGSIAVCRARAFLASDARAILEAFPPPPGRPNDIDAYLKHVQEVYITDAYHSCR
jgi:hypothetical protein